MPKQFFMHFLRNGFLFLLATAFTFRGISQQLPASNPLLVHSNDRIKFNAVTAKDIRQAVAAVIKLSDARVKKIAAVPAKAQTLANSLMAFDELSYELTEVGMKLQLIASTYTDDSSRNAANEQGEKLSVYANNLFLNEGLYKAMKQYASSAAAKSLKPNHQKFLRELILSFEKNGMKLNAAERKDLQALNEKIIGYGIQFDRNLAEYKDSVEFTEADLQGVSAVTKQPWKRANGKYMVTVNGPNYNEIVSNADNDSTRHTIFLRYNNRAYP
ncbi:MAG TPA: hypothetical protein VF610_03630, partial [Segetibacter sp.]